MSSGGRTYNNNIFIRRSCWRQPSHHRSMDGVVRPPQWTYYSDNLVISFRQISAPLSLTLCHLHQHNATLDRSIIDFLSHHNNIVIKLFGAFVHLQHHRWTAGINAWQFRIVCLIWWYWPTHRPAVRPPCPDGGPRTKNAATWKAWTQSRYNLKWIVNIKVLQKFICNICMPV